MNNTTDTNQASEPILPRDVLVMYSTIDLINLVSTVSEILAERGGEIV